MKNSIEVKQMIHPLKITSTLADETRYSIYEYILKERKTVTVQNIADKFGIHPNVARLHLTKLSEINIITADFAKTGKGGRPGRVYKASEKGVSLTFPRRDEDRLLKWTIQLIQEFGPSALTKCMDISYQDGFQQMKNYVSAELKLNNTLSFDQKLQLLSDNAALIGYIPQIQQTEHGKKVIFSIFNCPFQEQLTTHSEIVCSLHESYLKGQLDALFSSNEFVQIESMIHNCDLCKYEINVTEIDR
ncbi:MULTISPECIES: helix-turn-helix transcriptional regulator [Lysinibacillus]|uniref:helix-turn-helix transcriptional regulator n=1 Tax=Lysinibacillus TaxID=400634 RepID=UPI00257C0D33|nr:MULTISPECIES: helix-turn-helix domain-containing protein [Lysinibacillus]